MDKNVQIIKMITGEEVVCEYIGVRESDLGKVVVAKRPFGVAPNPTGSGIAVFPWSISSFRPSENEEFEILLQSVVMVHTPPEEIVNSYIEQTSGLVTGVSQAEKSLILG